MVAPISVWSPLPLLLWGCSSASPTSDRPPDALSRADTFKVLTYNTLHGLQVEGFGFVLVKCCSSSWRDSISV